MTGEESFAFTDAMKGSVESWKRNLLQLDRRNALVYFQPRRSAVSILEEDPDELLERLTTGRRSQLSFDYAERRIPVSGRASSDSNGDDDTDADPPDDVMVTSGDLNTDVEPLQLQRRLLTLMRRDQQWEEEQGLNVLFLALGFLEWVDEDGQPGRSPLVLQPCDLERTSPRDRFFLSAEEDDPAYNTTLAVKLDEFGITLPIYDPERGTVAEYLETVRTAVRDRDDWRVTQDIVLSTFGFSKLAMWSDLESLREHGSDHPLVRVLAGESPDRLLADPPSPLAFEGVNLDGGRLDDLLPLRDQYSILPADHSQLMAIAAASSGRNLVIDGPPGTGKSQTIANIIATKMAEGKRVLFVSEKTAALDVVKRRLENRNLGVFCLDLHSTRGTKANVYAQIQSSMDEPRAVPAAQFSRERLGESRDRLNHYVRALHLTRNPLEMSVSDAHGRFAKLRDLPHAAFEIHDVAALTSGQLSTILRAADQISLRADLFTNHSSSEWLALRTEASPLELANIVRKDMSNLVSALTSISSIAAEIANSLDLAAPESIAEMERLEAVLTLFGAAPGIPAHWLSTSGSNEALELAASGRNSQDERARVRRILAETIGDPPPSWDYLEIERGITLEADEQRALDDLLGDGWSSEIMPRLREVAASLRELHEAFRDVMHRGQQLSELLALQEPRSWPSVSELVDLADKVVALSPVPSAWFESGVTDQLRGVVDDARNQESRLAESESSVYGEFDRPVVQLVDRDMLSRYRTDHRSRVKRWVGGAYRSDSKALAGLRRERVRSPFDEDAEGVEQVFALKELLSDWEAQAPALSDELGDRFKGRGSDWDSIAKDLDLLDEVRRGWQGRSTDLAALVATDSADKQLLEAARATRDAMTRVKERISSGLAGDASVRLFRGDLEPRRGEQARRFKRKLPVARRRGSSCHS